MFEFSVNVGIITLGPPREPPTHHDPTVRGIQFWQLIALEIFLLEMTLSKNRLPIVALHATWTGLQSLDEIFRSHKGGL
jgi:hypothetical protein